MLTRDDITSSEDLAEGMARLDAFLAPPPHRRPQSKKANPSASIKSLPNMELVTGIEPVTPSLRAQTGTEPTDTPEEEGSD